MLGRDSSIRAVCSLYIQLALENDSSIHEVCLPTCNASIKESVAAALLAQLSTLSKQRYVGLRLANSNIRISQQAREDESRCVFVQKQAALPVKLSTLNKQFYWGGLGLRPAKMPIFAYQHKEEDAYRERAFPLVVYSLHACSSPSHFTVLQRSASPIVCDLLHVCSSPRHLTVLSL